MCALGWFRLGQIDNSNYLDAAVRGEPPHDGGVLHVHPLEDALRQLPVLGRLLKGGLSDNQVERILVNLGKTSASLLWS